MTCFDHNKNCPNFNQVPNEEVDCILCIQKTLEIEKAYSEKQGYKTEIQSFLEYRLKQLGVL